MYFEIMWLEIPGRYLYRFKRVLKRVLILNRIDNKPLARMFHVVLRNSFLYTGFRKSINPNPIKAITVLSQKAGLYPPVVSKMYPARSGPTEPPKHPLKTTKPKRTPWDRIPKYSATIGDIAVKNPPWARP